MAIKPRLVRLQVEIPEATAAAIDNYRFATRTPSRSQAARDLLKAGLAAQPSELQSR